MPYTTTSIPDLTRKVAVVTGANGGIGLEIARALAGAGAHVVIAARNAPKARSAHDDIMATHPGASLEIVELDLGSLESVAEAAAAINTGHDAIDILVNNAGVMALPEGRTVDGFETQFGVNHLGHWALTAQLMPGILRAEGARVVTQSSVARLPSRGVEADNPHLEGNYRAWKAYNQSKLANYHFALGLQQAFERVGAPAISLVAHPGLTNSDLQSTTQEHGGAGFVGWASEKIAKLNGMTPAAGAMPAVRAATDPEADGGRLYAPRFGGSGAAVTRPLLRPGRRKAIETLWAISERETGIRLVVEAPSPAPRIV